MVEQKVSRIAHAFRARGHFAAKLDPLRKNEFMQHYRINGTTASEHLPRDDRDQSVIDATEMSRWLPEDPDDMPDVVRLLTHFDSSTGEGLDLSPFGLASIDLDKRIYLGSILGMRSTDNDRGVGGASGDADHDWWTPRELIMLLREAYAKTAAVEYDHITRAPHRRWLQERVEGSARRGEGRSNWCVYDADTKLEILQQLRSAEQLEGFLGKKFPSSKRFGLDGAESLIPGLHALLSRGAELGVEGVELGMAHRGRMNVLVNVRY